MLNKVQFIGYLGKDPEVKSTSSGVSVANFSVASTEKWNRDGERQERTEWLRCSAWDKLADICGDYLKKGSLVYVEGALQTRKYDDKDGNERYVTECRVSTMKMLGGREDRDDDRGSRGNRDGRGDDRDRSRGRGDDRPPARSAPARPPAPKSGGGFDAMDDDPPF